MWEAAQQTTTSHAGYCAFNETDCGYADLYSPLFDDVYLLPNVCQPHALLTPPISMMMYRMLECVQFIGKDMTMREELRVLRDLFLLNVATHSIVGAPFMKPWKCDFRHILLVILRLLYLVYVVLAFGCLISIHLGLLRRVEPYHRAGVRSKYSLVESLYILSLYIVCRPWRVSLLC
jgi:hypothetical protein